jgi:hypothetical protein
MANTLITVAPGVFIDPLIRREIDPAEQYILLDAAGLKKLGLTSSQEKLLLRLEHAGLINTHKITPRRRLLNLSSWQRHLDAVDADPDFWENPDRRRRWRLACLSI